MQILDLSAPLRDKTSFVLYHLATLSNLPRVDPLGPQFVWCVCGHHFQQTGHQPGMVANPACSQLNRENGIFPVPVRDSEFGLASLVRLSRPA